MALGQAIQLHYFLYAMRTVKTYDRDTVSHKSCKKWKD